MSDTLSKSGLVLLEKIKADYFGNDLFPIQINVATEGQKLNDKGNFVIGCCAGPSCDISNLLHEMGHFSEREPHKLLKKPHGSWGFTYGKYWEICGQSGFEPQTDQSVRRELRVWAFQHNLEQHYGIKRNIPELVSSAVYISAFCYYNFYKEGAKELIESGCPYDEYKHLIRSEKERLELAAQEVEELSKTFTLQAFNDAWNHRIQLLENKNDKSNSED